MKIGGKIFLIYLFCITILIISQLAGRGFTVSVLGGIFAISIAVFAVARLFYNGIMKIEQVLSQTEKTVLSSETNHPKNIDLDTIVSTTDLLIKKILEKETNISNQENKMESMLQTMSEGIIALDRELKILVFNKNAEKFTGFTSQLAVGKPIDDILSLFGGDEKIIVSN